MQKQLLKTGLYKSIKNILETARRNAYRAVNFAMVQAYWNIGRLIVEEEQKGKVKAIYGKFLIKQLSVKLTQDFGKGFTETNIRYFRQFYLTFPIHHAVRDKSESLSLDIIHHAPGDKLGQSEKIFIINETLHSQLSWTHYRLLLKVENKSARNYYIEESIAGNWSTRQLERQINSLLFERLLMSKAKKEVLKVAQNQEKPQQARDIIKDPYVLEFLDLKENKRFLESDLENAIIDKLKDFLLELGKGFAFVERQYRITADNDHFHIDLVFYNYILKCFLLIDLKIGKLTHKDIGQIDFYVRYFEDNIKLKDDNPTIGLILCSEKNETIVKYSILNESKQIFASKYKLYLPTEDELKKELEKEIQLIRTENK